MRVKQRVVGKNVNWTLAWPKKPDSANRNLVGFSFLLCVKLFQGHLYVYTFESNPGPPSLCYAAS